MLDNYEEIGIKILNISLRRVWIVHLSSWWSCPMESFSSSGFLSCPWNHFALRRWTCHDHGSSMGSHQLLQRRCSWSHPYNWARRLVIYRTPSPILAWRIKFNILKGSDRTVGKKIRQVISPKREWRGYLTVRSKFPIQGYAQRIDRPTEEMGMPFLPPRVKEIGRKAGPDPVMQGKRRKVWSQLEDSRSF